MRFSAPTPVMSRPVRVCAVQYALYSYNKRCNNSGKC